MADCVSSPHHIHPSMSMYNTHGECRYLQNSVLAVKKIKKNINPQVGWWAPTPPSPTTHTTHITLMGLLWQCLTLIQVFSPYNHRIQVSLPNIFVTWMIYRPFCYIITFALLVIPLLDPRELEAFAERFKQRRIKLGVIHRCWNHWIEGIMSCPQNWPTPIRWPSVTWARL